MAFLLLIESIMKNFFVGGSNVTEIGEYTFPQRVTRRTFTPFLETILGTSLGSGEVLWAQCVWLEKYTGFGYRPTFRDFIDAGGAYTLNSAEWTRFKVSYSRVGRHKQMRDYVLTLSLNETLENVVAGKDLVTQEAPSISISEIHAFTTKEALITGLRGHLRRVRAKKL